MMCPNCRCFIPKSMSFCGYCGYQLSEGTEKTLAVYGAYDNGFGRESDYCGYNGCSQDLSYDIFYYRCSAQTVTEPDALTDETVLMLIAGAGSAVLLIILAILIVLL